jgi:hypothetical protein
MAAVKGRACLLMADLIAADRIKLPHRDGLTPQRRCNQLCNVWTASVGD